jgi:hypothetical protein
MLLLDFVSDPSIDELVSNSFIHVARQD